MLKHCRTIGGVCRAWPTGTEETGQSTEDNIMQTFIIYQNSLRALNTQINAIGSWTIAAEQFSKVATHLECSNKGGEGFTPEMFHDYEKVAAIEADDLNEVFQTGNIGPVENIQSFKKSVASNANIPMHSISVGDIIRDSDHHYHMVDPDGFTEITDAIWFGRDAA